MQPLARVFQADASAPDDPGGGKRTAQLKRQFENAFLYIRELGDEQAERFGRGLNYLFNDWVERFGPVKDCEVRIGKHTSRK